MFTQLRLQNFLSFKGPVTVPLPKFGVVVGANNSGKSNLLLALRFLNAASNGGRPADISFQNFNRTLNSLLYRDEKANAFNLSMNATSDVKRVPWRNATYEISIKFSGIDPIIGREHFSVDTSDGPGETQTYQDVQLLNVFTQPGRPSPTSLRGSFLYEHLRRIEYFHFDPNALRAPSHITPNPKIGIDGSGLPAVLDALRSEHPDIYEKIEADFRQCVPDVQRILLKTTNEGQKVVMLKQAGYTQPFSSSEISDGLLLFLALLCCINQVPKPSLILLEEPERGIHPRRLADVVALIGALVDKSDTQVLMSTHSPYLLDLFKDDLESVLVLDRDENGTSVHRAHEIVKEMNGLHGSPLGELWFSGALGGVPK